MTDTFGYGTIGRTISDLHKRNPSWSSTDIRRKTGMNGPQVWDACKRLKIKLAPVLQAIPIDKNIPMPKPPRGVGKKYNYPWKDMQIGDSFLYPSHVNYGTARGNVEVEKQRLGRKFALRTTPEGLRCWRIA